MNLTKKQIDIISRYTPKELKGKSLSLWEVIGYFVPAGANWSYKAGYVKFKGLYIPVVTMFGKII